jgi:hypothetical protein
VEHLGEAADLDGDRLAGARPLVGRAELLDALVDGVVVALDAGDDEGSVAVLAA